MTIAVKPYHRLQGTAPLVLAGTAGYLITLLDAILATGFNTKNVSSITVAANVATCVTVTAHGLGVDDVVLMAGANEGVFNGEFRVTTITDSTTFTFAVTTGLSSASGTLTVKIAPLNWTKVYSGTNKAVYRSADSASNQLYLRVDDTQTTYATINSFETMSDVDTGTGVSSPVYWLKSSTANTTARNWYLFGDTKRFYLMAAWHATYPTWCAGYGFGDMASIKAGDAYNTFLIGHSASAPSNSTTSQSFTYVGVSNQTAGQYLARSYSQVGASVAFFKGSPVVPGASAQMGYGTQVAYVANPSDNGVHLVPLDVYETNNVYRGQLAGLYVPLESTAGNFPNMDKTLIYNGRTYAAVIIACVTAAGNCWFDITGGTNGWDN